MKIKKKFGAYLCLFCMLLSLCVPTIAFAADDKLEKNIENYKGIIDQVADDQTKLGNEDNAKFYLDVKTALEDADISEKTTIRGGYEIIDEIGSKLFTEYSNNINVMKTAWKSKFRKIAEQSGVEMGSMTKYDSLGNPIGSENVDTDELNDATVKVNILTWNNTKDLKEKDQGVIMEMLKGFDDATSFTSWIQGIAIALTIVFGGATMLTMISDRQMSTEALQREFLKLLLGVWFIMNFKFFALLVIRLGTLVVEQVLGIGTEGIESIRVQQVANALWQSLAEVTEENPEGLSWIANITTGIGNVGAGISASFSNVFGSFVGFFGSGIIQLASSLVIYAVAAEIGIRYIFTPIAIADLYSERFRSNGWMWLKKLFACSMQGAVIFMIIFVINIIKKSVNTFDPITNTAINLTMIGMFAKSRSVANDIIGVH